MVERFDVGLAPLLDSRFNRAKSDLKILEYGICGIPAVASKVLPYVGAIDHNASGLIAASPKDWIKSIRRLVEDPELRSRLGAAARVRAERRTVDRVITKWIDAYGLSGTSRQDDS
jgi:glycosyltransferase involved in cell wall biosynthesis